MHADVPYPYELPDLSSPIVPVKLVAEDHGTVVMAGILRLTTEAYLLMDRSFGSPEDRWEALIALQEAVRVEARDKWGLQDTYASISPAIARAFGKRLRALGWRKSNYECWVRGAESSTFSQS